MDLLTACQAGTARKGERVGRRACTAGRQVERVGYPGQTGTEGSPNHVPQHAGTARKAGRASTCGLLVRSYWGGGGEGDEDSKQGDHTEQQKCNNHNDEDMKTFQLMKHARLFQNIRSLPRMIFKWDFF
jgi:hypothetical protein